MNLLKYSIYIYNDIHPKHSHQFNIYSLFPEKRAAVIPDFSQELLHAHHLRWELLRAWPRSTPRQPIQVGHIGTDEGLEMSTRFYINIWLRSCVYM